ncbi:Autotransporter-associated beta strand repeat protein [Aquisphaera giovannonii]|uniref:Autotransporter-associated beta strand repeat protein n=1 Tax=Aquisphaera giovannonii TaxID=406548 RepID=A0A5B9WGB5_9BACT|nr:Ig-like domain repeat protein [Aquisphaera giovannonii]QEH39055.1 Autotransporter-associated beta strand repeat protein [Aquisphaera giovannonii]
MFPFHSTSGGAGTPRRRRPDRPGAQGKGRRRFRLESLEDRCLLSTDIWTGLFSANWANPGNWRDATTLLPPTAAPTAGDDLVFPTAAFHKNMFNNIAPNTAFHSISIQDSLYTITGNAVSVAKLTDASTAGALILTGVVLDLVGSGVVDVGPGVTMDVGRITGSVGLDKQGPGQLRLLGGIQPNVYAGLTKVETGTLLLGKVPGVDAVPGDLEIDSAGTVLLAASDQIDDAAHVTIVGAGIAGVLGLDGHRETIGPLSMRAGVISGTGTLTLTGGVQATSISNALGFAIPAVISAPVSLGNATQTFDVALGPNTRAVGSVPGMMADLVVTGGISSIPSLDSLDPLSVKLAGLDKIGAGAMLLAGLNTYLGPTTIRQGELIAASNQALGANQDGIPKAVADLAKLGVQTTVSGGATLGLTGGIAINPPQLNVNGGIGVENISGANVLGIIPAASGAMMLADSTTVHATAGALVINDPIKGAGGLIKDGIGPVVLGNTESYKGDTTVNAGNLVLAIPYQLPTSTKLTIGTNDQARLNGHVLLGGTSQTVAALSITRSYPGDPTPSLVFTDGPTQTLTVNGPTALHGGPGFEINTNGGALVVNGAVTTDLSGYPVSILGNLALESATTFTVNNGTATPADFIVAAHVMAPPSATLTKAGTGSMTLSGSNTSFTAPIVVSQGTLVAANPNALGTMDKGTTVAGGATLDIQTGPVAEPLTLLAGSTLAAPGALTGPISLAGAVTFNVGAGDSLFVSGVISDSSTAAGSLIKTGNGTLILNGPASNTYTGGTTVDSGLLDLGKAAGKVAVPGPLTIATGSTPGVVRLLGDNQISPSAAVAINGGVLNLNGRQQTVGPLSMRDGSITGAGTLKLNDGIVATSTSATTHSSIASTIDLAGKTLTVTANAGPASTLAHAADLVISGAIVGLDGAGVTKEGEGTLGIASNANSYQGKTTINKGVLSVSGSLSADSAVVVNAGGTLSGTGTVNGPATVNAGGSVEPGSVKDGAGGILAMSGGMTLAPDAIFHADMDSTGHDVLRATGGVLDLNGSSLVVDMPTNPTAISPLSPMTIIQPTLPGAVKGTFKDLAEGAYVTATNGMVFQITYKGGANGNDVVLSPASATWVSASPSGPSTYGQQVQVSATTSLTGLGGGTITFFDNGIQVASPIAVHTHGSPIVSASLTFPGTGGGAPLAAGAHSFVAKFTPDAGSGLDGSTSTAVPYAVNKAIASVSQPASSVPNVVPRNTPLTLTVFVTPASAASGTPTGTVTFYDGSASLGQAPVQANAAGTAYTAALSLDKMAGGSHSITAVYGGDADYKASDPSAALSVIVDSSKISTSVSQPASSVPNVVPRDMPLTFTVSVIPGPGDGAPTGTVTFYSDGSTVLGTAPVQPSSAGTAYIASLNIDKPAGGTHKITAVYGGDSSYKASDPSLALTVIVQDAKVATSVSTPASSVSGVVPRNTPVTFTVNVTPSSSGAGAPTGVVKFYDGGSYLGSAAVQSNSTGTAFTAALSVDKLAGGKHAIAAVYEGDVNYLASSPSSPLDLTVDNTKATLTVGQPVSSISGVVPQETPISFVVNLMPSTSGDGVPTGTVTFYDGGSPVGIVPVQSTAAGGAYAKLDLAALAGGAHSITAAYSGDAAYQPSSPSAPTSVTVDNQPLVKVDASQPLRVTSSAWVTRTVKVRISKSTTWPVRVAYQTLNGTAVAGTDYQRKQGVVVIPRGKTSATVRINVRARRGDATARNFTFRVLGATNASVVTQAYSCTVCR